MCWWQCLCGVVVLDMFGLLCVDEGFGLFQYLWVQMIVGQIFVGLWIGLVYYFVFGKGDGEVVDVVVNEVVVVVGDQW